MRKKRAFTKKMYGALHELTVKGLSHKRIQKILADKNEVVAGAWVPSENTIYLDYEQTEQQLAHCLLHEWAHAFFSQTETLDEEARCDIMAAALMKVFKVTNIKQLLEEE